MGRWALGVVIVAAVVAIALQLTPVRRVLVGSFSKDYETRAVPGVARAAPASVRLIKVAEGFRRITDIQFVPGAAGQAVVLEQTGRARLVQLSAVALVPAQPGETLLQLPVRSNSELGLLGLAFHPDYVQNGRLFVHANPADGAMRSELSEWHLPAAQLGQSRASKKRVLFEVEQPYQNHNGGQLAFGPDGLLYLSLGDGGWRDDPRGHGQNQDSWLGSILRFDVAQDAPTPERFASGLRNAWKFTFLPDGRIVAGDVGQDRYEEIDLIRHGDNLGWNIREGRHCFKPETGCRTGGLVEPIFEYPRSMGTSVTGGHVYRGASMPALQGAYIFGDFNQGRLFALRVPDRVRRVEATVLGRWPLLFSTFGVDAAGDVYVADYKSGAVFRLAPPG